MSSPKVTYSYEDGTSNTIRPTSVTYPDGRVLTYYYGTSGGMNDKLSRVECLGFDGTGNLVQPAYLGLGTQVRTTLSEPQVRWDLATGSSPNPYAGLDRFGRVIDNKWTNYNTSATLDQIKYTYDRASNRTSRENVVAKAQTTPKYFDELYSYDGSNRLTLMERGQLAGSPPTSITNKQFAQDWGLDPTGNWKVFKEDANGDGSWELNQTRTSNPVNEITAINETAGPSWVTPGYDSAGNMMTIPRPAEPTGEFTGIYDAWNRLVELRGLNDTVVGRYEYDGLTRRVVKHTFPGWEELEAANWDAMTLEDWNGLQLTQAHRRDYYYNSSWQILEERVENDTAFDRQYVWGLQYINGLVFRDRQLTSSVQRTYALQDANWNVTALTDDNGVVVERYGYPAYGVPTFLNPDFTPSANNEPYDWDLLYAGYKWDSESAFYQVRFRYLQPALGGWMTRDPIGNRINSLNLFEYCNSGPVTKGDPKGLFAEVTGGGSGFYQLVIKSPAVTDNCGGATAHTLWAFKHAQLGDIKPFQNLDINPNDPKSLDNPDAAKFTKIVGNHNVEKKGLNGTVIQLIEFDFDVKDCNNAIINSESSKATVYESWSVIDGIVYSDNFGGTKSRGDIFKTTGKGKGTKGTMTVKGSVMFVKDYKVISKEDPNKGDWLPFGVEGHVGFTGLLLNLPADKMIQGFNIEKTITRSITAEWCCCAGMQKDTVLTSTGFETKGDM